MTTDEFVKYCLTLTQSTEIEWWHAIFSALLLIKHICVVIGFCYFAFGYMSNMSTKPNAAIIVSDNDAEEVLCCNLDWVPRYTGWHTFTLLVDTANMRTFELGNLKWSMKYWWIS